MNKFGHIILPRIILIILKSIQSYIELINRISDLIFSFLRWWINMNISNLPHGILISKNRNKYMSLLKVCRNYAILKINTQAVIGHRTNYGLWFFPPVLSFLKSLCNIIIHSSLCLSVRPSVCSSVRSSVCLSSHFTTTVRQLNFSIVHFLT